uniref:Putative salivary lipocalin n=1 Tax=Panstrongylus megistus TaxID=65343 RepID=A0A069DQK9_9HEMI
MKIYRIIAVTFLGILVHACAEDCQLEPATKDFDSDKYFSIPKVFAVYSQKGPSENVCREYETKKNTDGTIVTTVYGDYKIGENSYHELTCTNTEKSDSKGQFDVECEFPKGTNITTKIQLETSVLDTDNKKYVILQRCSKTGQDDIVVLQTNKDRLEQEVENYFDKKGWTFNQWVSTSCSKRSLFVCNTTISSCPVLEHL